MSVSCGDWIYPARESSCGVRYPIDWPHVAEIFLPSTSIGKTVATTGEISSHLRGPRVLEFSVEEEPGLLHITSLKNRQEELFEHKVDFDIMFNLAELTRTSHIPSAESGDRVSIFFADVLLQAYLAGKLLPNEITFRKASMSEIESLGRW